MKQRLGIAAAMLSDPDLLLLDEPANGLDPAGIVAMRETLRYFTGEPGKTVLISSHLLHEVEQLADVVGHHRPRQAPARRTARRSCSRDAGQVKVRVPSGDMAQAADDPAAMSPAISRSTATDSGRQAGWFTVGVRSGRAAEINRALAEAGIYAAGLSRAATSRRSSSRSRTPPRPLPRFRRDAAGCRAAGPPPPSPLPPPGTVPPA